MESQLTPYAASKVLEIHSVLVLAPHPDDEVFGCGGTLALHVAAGTRVYVVICTSGEAAGFSAVREAESRQASRVLGYEEPIFWGMPDRGIMYGEALVQRIVDVLGASNANIVYAPSLWENHPDHRAIALAALEAARRSAQCELMFYEVGAPLRPNLLIDITSVLANKRAAMDCFPSQLALQRYDRHIEALNVFRSYTLGADVAAAEAFERYDAASLQNNQLAFFTSEYSRQQVRGLMAMPQALPLVSVLIRSMDRPELDRALDSISIQTWMRVEVVVVNAKGSSHRPLPAWCGRFPLRLIHSDRPLHRSAAANRAIDCANGTALLLLDDDDWLDADHLHKLVSALQTRPTAVAAVTGTRGVDSDGIVVHEWKDPVLRRLMLANQMPIMSVLFRKNTNVDAPRFDEQLDLFEDWDFWLQTHMKGEFVNVPGISATYLIRVIGGSGVHEAEHSRLAQARLRKKWSGRWPDVWFDALRNELDEGIDQRHVLEIECNNLQKKLDSGEQERILLNARFDEHMHEFSELHLILQEEKQQYSLLQVALNNQSRKLSERDCENLKLLSENQNLVREAVTQLESARVFTLQRHDETNTILTFVKKQRNGTVHELLLARQKLHTQSQELMRIEHMQIEFGLHLKALLDSKSWRITGPLRSLGTIIRKLRRSLT